MVKAERAQAGTTPEIIGSSWCLRAPGSRKGFPSRVRTFTSGSSSRRGSLLSLLQLRSSTLSLGGSPLGTCSSPANDKLRELSALGQTSGSARGGVTRSELWLRSRLGAGTLALPPAPRTRRSASPSPRCVVLDIEWPGTCSDREPPLRPLSPRLGLSDRLRVVSASEGGEPCARKGKRVCLGNVQGPEPRLEPLLQFAEPGTSCCPRHVTETEGGERRPSGLPEASGRWASYLQVLAVNSLRREYPSARRTATRS